MTDLVSNLSVEIRDRLFSLNQLTARIQYIRTHSPQINIHIYMHDTKYYSTNQGNSLCFPCAIANFPCVNLRDL